MNGGAWTTLGTNTVTFGGTNGKLCLRGKSSVGTNGATISFGNSTPVGCSGDIRTLVDYENYSTVNTSEANFSKLFNGRIQLTTAPDLPSMQLAQQCYYKMFNGCTSLTSAPALPATTLADHCYTNMFAGCTALTRAPELPALALAPGCYANMFNGCTSLNYIKMLAADISAEQCLSNWVHNVSSSGTFVTNRRAGMEDYGDSLIPTGWVVTYIDYPN